MTSEAEVLWILLAFRLRPVRGALRLASEDPGPSRPRRSQSTERPPEGRKSGIYARSKIAAK